MRDPLLLTPGPLSTSPAVKEAMLRDMGSRDAAFLALSARVRERLAQIAGAQETHVAVPLQGSGTFAVEAMLGTLLPREGRLLVLVNGAYGRRMVRMAEIMRRDVLALESSELAPVDVGSLDRALAADPRVTHVAVVHCETTAGVLNPVEEVAAVVARHGRSLLIDAMSAFGALPLCPRRAPFEAAAASSNKALEGVPGMAFVIASREALRRAEGNSHSLSLDLHDQWRAFEANAGWRFTPPTHVLCALERALAEHEAEGGVEGRGARYRKNCEALVEGMRALGFRTLLPDAHQAPIIVSFRMPAAQAFVFQAFYDGLRERGFVIYPGKLTEAESFRVGCIGRVGEAEIRSFLGAVRATLDAMGVPSGAP